MMVGTYFKLVEYRLYSDKLIFHTYLFIHGGKIIPYKNVTKVKIDQRRKIIIVEFRNEEGLEKLEIENRPEDSEDNRRRILNFIEQRSN